VTAGQIPRSPDHKIRSLDHHINRLGAQIMVRGAGDPQALAEVVTDTVHALDPDMPVEDVQTLEEARRESLATPRLTAMLLAIFAGLAMVVTLLGSPV
jgi:hypothetical protein